MTEQLSRGGAPAEIMRLYAAEDASTRPQRPLPLRFRPQVETLPRRRARAVRPVVKAAPGDAAAALAAERRLETPRAAGVAGLLFSALFVATLLLVRVRPAPGSSAEEIANFYLERDSGRVALAGMYIVPFAGIAFLWFVAAIRSHLGAGEDRFFATVLLGSGLLFVAMLFAASACAGALVAGVKFLDEPPPSADGVVLARSIGFAFFFVFGVRIAAVFMLVVSTIGLRTGLLPRWLVVAGYVCGLVFLLTVVYVEMLALLLPAWVTAVSVVILRTGRRGPAPVHLTKRSGSQGSERFSDLVEPAVAPGLPTLFASATVRERRQANPLAH